MAAELFIKSDYTRFERCPKDGNALAERGLRVYRNSPEDVVIQLRTFTDKQVQYAVQHLAAADLDRLIETLTALRAELR